LPARATLRLCHHNQHNVMTRLDMAAGLPGGAAVRSSARAM
jgi:hypothetical protein